MRAEIEGLRDKLKEVDSLGNKSSDTSSKVADIENSIDEINEKLWELDKSWRNNLVFYGVRSEAIDEHPSVTETKVREVIRLRMHITRDVPMSRVRRTPNGPEVRGCKPITVCFEKYSDKDEILRKAKLLTGTSIYVGEDFSKRVKDQRGELQRFWKTVVKRKRPNAKCRMQYDKLIVDNEVYVYNDLTGQIEQVNQNHTNGNDESIKAARKNLRTAPSSINSHRSRIQKSFSTESSLNHMVPNSPVHPDLTAVAPSTRSRENSPTKPGRRSISPRKRLPNFNSHHCQNGGNESASHENPESPVKINGDDEVGASAGIKQSDDEEKLEILDVDHPQASGPAPMNGNLRKSNPNIPETIPE